MVLFGVLVFGFFERGGLQNDLVVFVRTSHLCSVLRALMRLCWLISGGSSGF